MLFVLIVVALIQELNPKELERWLNNNNFEILDPIVEEPLKLLLKLKYSKIVITEQGSIIFNIPFQD